MRQVSYKEYKEVKPYVKEPFQRSVWAYTDPQLGWFHEWTRNSDNEICALVETKGGSCRLVPMEAITFMSNP